MTLTKSEVCVLIPAYNEEKRIGPVIRAVKERGFAVVAVDDGSKDGTARVIREAGAECVVSPVNQGKGAAIRKGFEWVLRSPYQAVVVVDADGQHDPEELDSFVKALSAGDAELVLGNRMHHPEGMSVLRLVTNRTMSWIISAAAGQKVPDTQCGYRAFTRKALENIELKTDRFEIESEMILSAGRKKLRMRSIPIRSVYRDEVSRIRPVRDTLRFFKFLFRFIISQK